MGADVRQDPYSIFQETDIFLPISASHEGHFLFAGDLTGRVMVCFKVGADISDPQRELTLRASSSEQQFAGYQAAYATSFFRTRNATSSDEEEEEEEQLRPEAILSLLKVRPAPVSLITSNPSSDLHPHSVTCHSTAYYSAATICAVRRRISFCSEADSLGVVLHGFTSEPIGCSPTAKNLSRPTPLFPHRPCSRP